MNKCFFFDRDGIVNVLLDNAYVRKIEEFILSKNFLKYLNSLKAKTFLL